MMSLSKLLLVFSALFASYAAKAKGFAPPQTKWVFQTDGPIRGSAVAANDTIYFGSSDGHLYAASKVDGSLKWKFQTGGAIAGAPAVSGSTIVVSGRSTQIYAIDGERGKERWSFEMQPDIPALNAWNYFTATPVIDGTQVLVGSGDGHLYAIDIETGELNWKFETTDSIRAAPLVEKNTVYLASCDDYIYVLSRDDGELQWKFETEGATKERGNGFIRSDIFSQPALKNDLLIFASRDSNVYALDVKERELKWKFTFNGSTWAMSSAVDDDTVFAGWSTNNRVCALDLSTGEKKWEYKANAHCYTKALRLGDDVIWGSADGNIYSFDHETGEKNWEYNIGAEVYSSVTQYEGTLYCGSDDGRLYALQERTAPSHKAVYFPHYIPENGRGFIRHPSIAPFLVERGFELLDSSKRISEFLSNRILDGDPSVVVFAYVHVPAPLLSQGASKGLLREYLEAGGKVVWMGGNGFLHCLNEEWEFMGRDPSHADRLLDMNFIELEDAGNYYSVSTQAGRNIGFPASLKTSWASLAPGNDITPLAINEYGNVGAWQKSFHPRLGSGWFSFCTIGTNAPVTENDLRLIERVASHTLD